MRDPARIKVILGLLEQIWTRHPDMRLGQLIEVIVAQGGPKRDAPLFYIEDDVALDRLSKWEDSRAERFIGVVGDVKKKAKEKELPGSI
jgi:uncharacterized protein YihD (DUF1040 family)